MRKICTVLFLNLLRSSRRPKIFASCTLLLLIGIGGLVMLHPGSEPLTLPGQQANAVNAKSNTSSDVASASAATSQPAKPATPQPKSNKGSGAASTPKPQAAGSSEGSSAASSAELKIKEVSLDPPAMVCKDQQPMYAIDTAQAATSTSLHAAGAIHWYWETRVEGGEATDNPPISSQSNAQNVAASTNPIHLQNDTDSSPLLLAPTSSTYSYSFRLHITAPNDVTSDWVLVPVVLDNSCSTATQ